jgi:hypothetical protein
MERFVKKTVVACLCIGASVWSAAAQPTPPPRGAPKPERVESELKRVEEARRSAEAAKAANAAKKSSSSTSKVRAAEIRAFTFSEVGGRGNRPVIIKSDGDAKEREQLKEDLLVMCRILEKAAQPHLSDVHKAAGIDLLALGGGNRTVRTIYLEDYGVLFTLNVRIPLLSDEKAEEPEEKETARTEEWEETRNELFGQKRRIRRAQPGQGPSYDEEDVQQLKDDLLDAMKNASNIRNLKASDWITVAVSGPGVLESEVIQVERGRGEDLEKLVVPRIELFGIEEGQSGGESMMVLRIRKGELDELVKKEGSPEEASQALENAAKVQIY